MTVRQGEKSKGGKWKTGREDGESRENGKNEMGSETLGKSQK